ncbi:MAG: hypothetical protein J5641_02130 [Bacteroidales bacterium]|nr:hypothetical protein [Bacteroidales bacterium]
MTHRLSLIFLSILLIAVPVQAQKKKSAAELQPLSGLYVTVEAGLLIPSDKQANFYNGDSRSPNNLMRVLKSEMYGTQIWNDLVNRQLISPSAIHDYSEFKVEEFADMYYRLTFQIGVGFRYVYDNGWGWLARFDFSEMTAAGQFLLSSNNGTGILGQNNYVVCGIYGRERRVLIDFGIAKRIPLTKMLDLEVDFGFDLNNTKVSKNGIRVPDGKGQTYNILDIWGGQTPYTGIGTYEYINQGTIGIGGFGTLALSYRVPTGAIDFGYTYYHVQTKFRGYNEDDCYAPQHVVFLRFNLNNFSFFDKK